MKINLTAIISLFFSLLLVHACTAPTITNKRIADKTTTRNGREVIVRKAGTLQVVESPKPDTIKLIPDPFSALLEMDTKFGTLKIELFFDAGEHRTNFLKLAKAKHYDSLLFHRVIRNFMAQTGDPQSRNASKGSRLGVGDVGYQLESEIGQHYYHIKGALAAARQPDETNPDKKSSGSQFYIVQGANVSPIQLDKNEREYDMVYTTKQRELYYKLGGSPQLDMEYTVFGRIYEGFSIIDSICNASTDAYARPKEDSPIAIRIIRE